MSEIDEMTKRRIEGLADHIDRVLEEDAEGGLYPITVKEFGIQIAAVCRAMALGVPWWHPIRRRRLLKQAAQLEAAAVKTEAPDATKD